MEESIRLTEVRKSGKLKITVRLPRNHGTIMEQIHLNGIFRQCPEAQELLENMTLEEKVAQVFLFRCPSENALAAVQTYQPGGFTLDTLFLMALG